MKKGETKTANSGLLGFWDLAFMGLGSVVGAGIVTYVGIAISWTGRSAWIAYALAILLGFLANLPLILMSSAARIKGGNYSFLATTLGEVGGGWYGVQQILNAFYFSTMALSLGNYMHAISPAIPVKGVAIFSLVLFALIKPVRHQLYGQGAERPDHHPDCRPADVWPLRHDERTAGQL